MKPECHRYERCRIRLVTSSVEFVLSANRKGEGFMTCPEASHQGIIKMFRLSTNRDVMLWVILNITPQTETLWIM